MQIDPNRAVRHPSECCYLGAGHTLYKPQNQCLSVCSGQAPDSVENSGGRAFVIPASVSAPDIVVRRVLCKLVLRRGTPVVVIRSISGNRRQPRSKASDVPQCRQAPERDHEDILNKVIHLS
jgi:hypothetical protein